MALPPLSIKLFPPRDHDASYVASGKLTIPIADAPAFCEWILSQPGEFDEYLQAPVITLQAFMYLNTARNSGKTYHSVTLKEPKAGNQVSGAFGRQQQTPPSPCYHQEAPEDDEVPF